jgi:hypothetical protein
MTVDAWVEFRVIFAQILLVSGRMVLADTVMVPRLRCERASPNQASYENPQAIHRGGQQCG